MRICFEFVSMQKSKAEKLLAKMARTYGADASKSAATPVTSSALHAVADEVSKRSVQVPTAVATDEDVGRAVGVSSALPPATRVGRAVAALRNAEVAADAEKLDASVGSLIMSMFPGVQPATLYSRLSRPLAVETRQQAVQLSTIQARAERSAAQAQTRRVKRQREESAAAAVRGGVRVGVGDAADDSAGDRASGSGTAPPAAKKPRLSAPAPAGPLPATASSSFASGSLFAMAAALSSSVAPAAPAVAAAAIRQAADKPRPANAAPAAASTAEGEDRVTVATVREPRGVTVEAAAAVSAADALLRPRQLRDVHRQRARSAAAFSLPQLKAWHVRWRDIAYKVTVDASATGSASNAAATGLLARDAAGSGSSASKPGGGAVVLADISAALKAEKKALKDQRKPAHGSGPSDAAASKQGAGADPQAPDTAALAQLPLKLQPAMLHKGVTAHTVQHGIQDWRGAWVNVTRCKASQVRQRRRSTTTGAAALPLAGYLAWIGATHLGIAQPVSESATATAVSVQVVPRAGTWLAVHWPAAMVSGHAAWARDGRTVLLELPAHILPLSG